MPRKTNLVSSRVAVRMNVLLAASTGVWRVDFRAAGAFVVGSTTAGADGNVSQIPLPGGMRAMITGIGVFYPDGRPTQRVGIVPDLVVHPTVEGIRAGRDEVLEAALEAVLGRQVRFSPGP